MSETENTKFRAVIVGGGPVGLCLAHAFTLGNIDYILLEKRDTPVEPSGFSVTLWSHTVRILDQLGLLEEGSAIAHQMKVKYNIWADGSEMSQSHLYDKIKEEHGHPWLFFHRQKLLDLLYKTLPAKESRVLTEKRVVSIGTHTKGVNVHCDDGSIVEGSIVVGCDGVHSRVRGIMRKLRLQSTGKALDSDTPMVAQFQLLAGHLPHIPRMDPGSVWEVRDNGMGIQVFMMEHEGWFFAYRHLPEPISHYTKYSDEDANAFAEDIMDHAFGNGIKFRDLWEVRKWARLLNIEEGFVQHWHEDRIVLMGDSLHKMTPNAGLGLNQGWQDVVALTNVLRDLLSKNPDPDTPSLTSAFEEYRRQTEKAAKDTTFMSKMYCRITSWHNFAYKLVDLVGPYVGGDPATFFFMGSPIIKRGLILDGIPEPGHKAGSIPWENKPYTKVNE